MGVVPTKAPEKSLTSQKIKKKATPVDKIRRGKKRTLSEVYDESDEDEDGMKIEETNAKTKQAKQSGEGKIKPHKKLSFSKWL